jgi:hypothetical protein
MGARKLTTVFAACVLLGAIATANTPSQANIVEFDSVTAVPGGFDWTYTAALTNFQIIDVTANPDFFTVFDFGPSALVSDTGLLNTNFTYSTSLTSTHAFGTSPTDDPSILNVNFTANPGTPVVGPGPLILGTFTLFSTSGPGSHDVFFDGQGTNNNVEFTPLSDVGLVAAPISAVPTPIMGVGLPGMITAVGALGLLGWRRKRKAQEVA